MMSISNVWNPTGRYPGKVDMDRCRAGVFSNYRTMQCARKGVVEEGGYKWCKQHAPSAIAAKDEARRAEDAKRHATYMARYTREEATTAACAGLTTAELEALGEGGVARMVALARLQCHDIVLSVDDHMDLIGIIARLDEAAGRAALEKEER